MATGSHLEEMMSMMKQQMAQLMKLQEENNQLRAAGGTHPSTTEGRTTTTAKKTKTPDRPNVDDREWKLFKDSWRRYKTMTNLTTTEEIRLELRAACSNEVNKLLFEFIGAATL